MAPRQSEFTRLMAIRDNFLEEVTNYCLLGCTNAQLAEFFAVHPDTVSNWLNHAHNAFNKAFYQAVERGRVAADARVAGAIFRKAEGFMVETEQLVSVGQGKGVSKIEKVKVQTYFPPDTSAAKFWLTNRNRNWRDKQTHEHSGVDGAAIPTELTVKFVDAKQELITLPTQEQITDVAFEPVNDDL